MSYCGRHYEPDFKIQDRLEFICPVCNGDGDYQGFCACDGLGAITAAEAARWRDCHGIEPTPLPPIPTRDEMCDDCAFRQGSPERDNGPAWSQIQASIERGKPFHCHVGMHLTARHGLYVPRETDHTGKPIGHPLCAGWRAARAAFEKRTQEEAGS